MANGLGTAALGSVAASITPAALQNVNLTEVNGTPITSPLPVSSIGGATEATLLGVAGLLPVAYDNIALTQNATQDIWVFKVAAATVFTITITYTGTDKGTISTVVKT